VTLTTILPFPFIVPPITSSPSFFTTSFDSPVTIDSSIVVEPLTIKPSVGIFTNGFTTIKSPISSSFIFTSTSSLSTIILAFFAPTSRRDLISFDALPFAKLSRYFPSKKKKIIIPPTKEKFEIGIPKIFKNPVVKLARVPIDISKSIFITPLNKEIKALLCILNPTINVKGIDNIVSKISI